MDNDEEVAEEEETAEDDKATEDDKDDIKSLISKILEKLIGAIKVTVAGELPEDAQLVLGEGSKLKAETLLKQLVGDVNYVGVYSIDVDGADVGNTVEVTLDGLDIPQGKHVYVLHVLDSQEAIQAAIAANVENLLQSNNVLALLAAAKEAFLGGGYVYGITQEATVDGNSISFTTDSFSDFIVYTVDFHYDGYTYSIPGESSILLSELFDAIGFTAYTADYAESVVFSDPTLLEVSQNEDQTDWTLTSLAAFDTDETLTVTFKNGDTLELAVTDATASAPTLTISVGLDGAVASWTDSAIKNLPDAEKTFEYTVTLSSYSSLGYFNYTITSGTATVKEGTINAKNGTLDFELVGGQTLIITGIESSSSYTVYYTLTQTTTAEGFTTTSESTSGYFGISGSDRWISTNDATAEIVNTYGSSGNRILSASTLTSKIKIGINESYYDDDSSTYDSDASGNSGKTYHAFPYEPRTDVSAIFSRAINYYADWRVSHEWTDSSTPPEFLTGNASAYIDSSILDSQYFTSTTIGNSTTYGLFDSTGAINKQFLKLTDDDYNQIIRAWLTHMKNNTDSGFTANENDDWSNVNPETDYVNYEFVPYIIKYTSNGVWVIDSVIVPKTQVKLTYNLNIPEGFTNTNNVTIPVKSYTVGTSASIYTTPAAYSNKIIVKDKNNNTATFLYWTDSEGNRYGGSTGNNTLVMTKDTVLTAVWEAANGDLTVTKALVDSTEAPLTDTVTSFNMEVVLKDSSGNSSTTEYDYYVYNSVGVQQSSGKIIGTETISLKAGQYFTIKNIRKGDTYTVTEKNIPDGFDQSEHRVEGTISSTTEQRTITNKKYTTSTLTITKTNMAVRETAVFTISGDDLSSPLTVSIPIVDPKGTSITIAGLTIGQTYTVTEDTSWSWRYSSEAATVTINEDASKNQVTITNTKTNSYWLSGETHEKNVFGTAD